MKTTGRCPGTCREVISSVLDTIRQRALRFHVENIHTDQSVFLSTWLLDNGYRVFLHFKSGIVTEVKLGDNPPPIGRIDSPKNLEGLLLSGCLGKLTE